MILSEKLLYLRKRNRFSQLELSEKLNVSRQAISRWETGTVVPTLENLKCICDLYGVTMDYLLDETQDDLDDSFASNKKKETPAIVSNPKKKKRKIWIGAVILVVIAAVVAMVLYIESMSDDKDLYPIEETQREKVDTGNGGAFDITW